LTFFTLHYISWSNPYISLSPKFSATENRARHLFYKQADRQVSNIRRAL